MDANTLSTFAPIVFIMAIMYFLLIRPQQQQAKKLREKIGAAKRGDTVVTAAGILGPVVKMTLTDVRPKGGDVITDKG